MVLPACLSLTTVLLFDFAIGGSQRANQTADARCGAESETDQCQPGRGPELLVEPLSAKQSEQNAQTQFETHRPVGAQTFQVLFHGLERFPTVIARASALPVYLLSPGCAEELGGKRAISASFDAGAFVSSTSSAHLKRDERGTGFRLSRAEGGVNAGLDTCAVWPR